MTFGIENFTNNGFALIKNIFPTSDSNKIFDYTKNWIWENIVSSKKTNGLKISYDNFKLDEYSNFIDHNKIEHNKIAAAKFRYRIPNEEIFNIIRGKEIMDLVSEVSKYKNFKIWQDPGFGWLGYRIIRPITNDGYPPSCKNWGAAAGVYSLWIPISGCNSKSSIRFLPGSHLKNFKKYLPKNSKFTIGEYRLNEQIDSNQFVRLNCELGDAIIYHPATIHSEDSSEELLTRTNLEYRFMPF